MLIDFKSIPLTVLPNFKGGEKQMESNMHVDELNRIMHSRLVPSTPEPYRSYCRLQPMISRA